MVAKNAAAPLSLSPEQVAAYLDAIDVILDTAIATIRGIEKESARVCKIADTAVDRVGSKYSIDREMQQQTVDSEGRPTYTTVTETTSTIGRVMETEYEIVEVINGVSWTINTVMSRLMFVVSGVLTLAEESVIQD
jgi:DNA-binding phage protein